MANAYGKVFGWDVPINIDDMDELSLAGVVSFVNEQWQETKEENKQVVDTQKIAALTAIKIAKELLKLKGLQTNISDNYERKIKELIKQLDEAEISG
ncbi:cell division protein ZapA [Endomicrobium proavitum]|uniref:Cell division protein ZapA n=1 Tax=Endomicrobium proavitum TaxID=1408281 RepID=A0A0G3WGZ0_9BACT|nr:cell division protein ZapA [Endomicrobium proavitum]AKL97588.1 Cell division protein ZapA [Endomicrobium proavitum]